MCVFVCVFNVIHVYACLCLSAHVHSCENPKVNLVLVLDNKLLIHRRDLRASKQTSLTEPN